MNSNASYSPETFNSGQKWWFVILCDLQIWQMTLQNNNRAPLLCCLKLCVSFHSHRGILTGVAVRKRPIWVKISNLFVPCNLKNLIRIKTINTEYAYCLLMYLLDNFIECDDGGCFASSPKYSLKICILLKSYFWLEFQAETLYVCPKLCFGHRYKVSAWNSRQKCYFCHCIFSRDNVEELPKRKWNTPWRPFTRADKLMLQIS